MYIGAWHASERTFFMCWLPGEMHLEFSRGKIEELSYPPLIPQMPMLLSLINHKFTSCGEDRAAVVT